MRSVADFEPYGNTAGQAVVPSLDSVAVEGHALERPVTLPFELPTPIYGAMLAIWHFRPGLQRRFPLHKGQAVDYLRYLAWCAVHGRRQYAVLRALPDWDAALARPAALPALAGDDWVGGYSVAMLCYGVARYQYLLGPLLRDTRVRHRIARAYWRGERHKFHLPAPAAWQYAQLERRFGTVDGLAETLRLPRRDGDRTTAELIEAFGLSDVAQAFNAGAADAPGEVGTDGARLPPGVRGLRVFLPPVALRHLMFPLWHLRRRPDEFRLSGVTRRIPVCRVEAAPPQHPFGVNLFGYAKGEIGIGEDVRLVALALEAQGIPFCVVNVQPGRNVSQQDATVDPWITDQPRYAINLFCTTGIEHARYACEHGLEHFRGRYNIGMWPWELPLWPASCEFAFSMVDEIWGISRYTAAAYRNAGRPVIPMSLPVTVDCAAPVSRAEFGLPEDEYLFVFSFDFNSTFARKNPGAVVQAFQRAFPRRQGERAGLVVKASHVDPRRKAWRQLQRQAQEDPRIHVIADTLRRPQVLGLYKCCDCYVSLHRAEGFGRSLAESLLLDLQLVATGFSGNLDFCDEERVAVVRHRPRVVGKREYFHGHGQVWADPDIDHAAQLMREVFSRPRPVRPGQFDFSPATVGKRYAQRLRQIGRQLGLAGGAD